MIACVSEGNVFPKKKRRKKNVNFMSGLSPCVPEENEKTRGDKNKADLTHTLKHTLKHRHTTESDPLYSRNPASTSIPRPLPRSYDPRAERTNSGEAGKKIPMKVCVFWRLQEQPGPYSSVSEPGRKDTGCRSKPGGFFFSSSTLIHINKGPNHVTAQTTPTESWLSESSRGVTVIDGGLPE